LGFISALTDESEKLLGFQAGGVDYITKPFHAEEVLARVNSYLALDNLETAIQENQAGITHDPLPTVMADPTQMVQLFQNLVGNAIKYHGAEAPRVHISVVSHPAEWVFAVRDQGIGIDPQHHERIFVLFQRLHNRSEYPGTGIGLAVCKRIVERHGGRIWVESQRGQGSTFFFTMPVRGAAQ
jgi:chemotaxis family two-component system sensor kinase Cph1